MVNYKLATLVAMSCLTATSYGQPVPTKSQLDSPGGLSITAFDRLSKSTTFGGYFDTEWKSSGKENSFIAHRLVLQTSAQPHPAILFNTEIEYEYGGAVNALGNTGEIKLEQAWIDYRLNPITTLRAGIVLVPFGRLNYLHDSDYRDTTNRAIVNKYITPTTWSDTGIGVHGSFDIGDIGINYEAYVLNGLTTTPSTTTGIRSSRPGYKSDNSPDKALALRLGVMPSIETEFGVSFYNDTLRGSASNRSQDQAMNAYGFDFLHKVGAWEFAGEFALSRFTTPESDPNATQQDGYYLEARYRYMPDWIKPMIGADQFDHPTMTWFARMGSVDLNRGGSLSYGQTQSTVGFNYRPIQTLVFKMEYEFNRGNLTEGDYDTIWSSVAFGF